MTMVCKDCKKETTSLHNDLCVPCYHVAQDAWQARMAIRQDPAQFDMDRLVRSLLTQHWMHECQIIPNWMPNFPRDDTHPTCVVRYFYREHNDHTYLRYSKGPAQGYFWDMYGDDFIRPELALVAISQSPAPPRIDVVIPTHGN